MSLLKFDHLVDPFIPLTKSHPLSSILEKGQCLILKGSNGSGKTTLLKILAGLRNHSQGMVQSSSLFYCGHQSGLKGSWTVEQNLSFRLALYGRPNFLLDEVIACLKKFNLHKFLYQKVSCLSRGQQQQIALLSGFLSPYELWLLDEPFAHLDKEALQRWKGIMKFFCEKGGGIIYSTHQQTPISPHEIILSLDDSS
jgi:heme exporter protein A